jgi:hypothetical protein
MGGACSTYEERCIQGIGEETLGKQTTGKAQAYIGGYYQTGSSRSRMGEWIDLA